MIVFGQEWLLFGQSGCIPAKVVGFGQKWLYWGKVVVFGQRGFIRKHWLCSCKVVVIGQCVCIREKVVELGKSGYIGAKLVVFARKLIYSIQSGCIRAK